MSRRQQFPHVKAEFVPAVADAGLLQAWTFHIGNRFAYLADAIHKLKPNTMVGGGWVPHPPDDLIARCAINMAVQLAWRLCGQNFRGRCVAGLARCLLAVGFWRCVKITVRGRCPLAFNAGVILKPAASGDDAYSVGFVVMHVHSSALQDQRIEVRAPDKGFSNPSLCVRSVALTSRERPVSSSRRHPKIDIIREGGKSI
jgi:hypothetical protein